MADGWFVTGTDTGVGKTWISVGLMDAMRAQGASIAGMKPVASGCEVTPAGLRNQDALLLQEHASVAVDYDLVNPFAYEPPIAPHLAAQEASRPIDFGRIETAYAELHAKADKVIVEGVGGWLVPLSGRKTVADLAGRLQLPVILVVGMRLGCINHALLSVEAITARGLPFAGWVANLIDPEMDRVTDNLRTLAALIDAPLLGLVPHLHGRGPVHTAESLDASLLLR